MDQRQCPYCFAGEDPVKAKRDRVVHLTLPDAPRAWCGQDVSRGAWHREETERPETGLQGSGWKLCGRCLANGPPQEKSR